METIAVASRSFSRNSYLRNKVTETYPNSNIKFNDLGTKLDGEELVAFLSEADKAIIALEEIDDNILRDLPRLKHISKYGVGLDKIDFAALRKHNVSISHKPGVNRRSVAELTLTFMLLLSSRALTNISDLKNGLWKISPGNLLTGKTVGILGCGNVGKDVVKLLSPFDVQVLSHDVIDYETFNREHSVELVSLKNLLERVDILSIHLPLTSDTRDMISSRQINMMKKESIIINTSRGGIVNEDDLFESLRAMTISAAASDVFLSEPNIESPLLGLENFLGTPHIGGSTKEAILAMGQAAIDGLRTRQ